MHKYILWTRLLIQNKYEKKKKNDSIIYVPSFAFLLIQRDRNISDSHFKTKQVTPFILEFDYAVEGM